MAKPATRKIPIAPRALMARINRKLASKNLLLKAARGRVRDNLGAYYVVDTRTGVVRTDMVADPEKLGRDIGALAPWEVIDKS